MANQSQTTSCFYNLFAFNQRLTHQLPNHQEEEHFCLNLYILPSPSQPQTQPILVTVLVLLLQHPSSVNHNSSILKRSQIFLTGYVVVLVWSIKIKGKTINTTKKTNFKQQSLLVISMPRQEPGQSSLENHMATQQTTSKGIPSQTPTPSPSAYKIPPLVSDEMKQSYDCDYFHSRGLASPKDALYAMKVGRKATDRILSKSAFFSEGGLSCVIQNPDERIDRLNDDSGHSSVNQILQLDAESIQLGKVLGKGGFCAVYEAHIPSRLIYPDSVLNSRHGSSDGKTNIDDTYDEFDHDGEYCVKFLKANVLPERKKFARGIADLSIEAHFLASLNHPHILKLRAVSKGFALFDPNSPNFLSSLTHQPGLEGGCYILLDRLVLTLDKKINLEWKETQAKWSSFVSRTIHDIRGVKRKMFRLERITVALQLAQAMQYLHQHNICYRDLKPDNIGFDRHGSLKLFDFGLAKELKEHRRHPDGTYQLTANTGSKR